MSTRLHAYTSRCPGMCRGFLFLGGIDMNRNEQITKVTQEILEAFRTG